MFNKLALGIQSTPSFFLVDGTMTTTEDERSDCETGDCETGMFYTTFM